MRVLIAYCILSCSGNANALTKEVRVTLAPFESKSGDNIAYGLEKQFV